MIGDKLHGAVKLYSDGSLTDGRIDLILESTLKINRPAVRTKKTMENYLEEYTKYTTERNI
jgi:hypothetical protein